MMGLGSHSTSEAMMEEIIQELRRIEGELKQQRLVLEGVRERLDHLIPRTSLNPFDESRRERPPS